jgi:PEP-CTERM motif
MALLATMVYSSNLLAVVWEETNIRDLPIYEDGRYLYKTIDYEIYLDEGASVVEVNLGDVAYDPDGPPILKVINLDNVGVITLVETFNVTGSVPFTDWDEQLMTATWGPFNTWVLSSSTGFEWGDGTNGANAPTASVPYTWEIDHSIDFCVINFDQPVQPSETVTITKQILIPEGRTYFVVVEWPTVPEPGSMALIGVGLLAMIRKK